MHDKNLISQLLTQLLTAHHPEYGARLKQRLNALLHQRGLDSLDERTLGYKRFRELLEQGFGDLVNVQPPSEVGDILVSLKTSGSLPATAAPSPSVFGSAFPPIRSEIWQAFSNPDLERKRFFHKQTAAVKHFIQGDSSSSQVEVDESPDDFIEIDPIPGALQLQWMRQFLGGIHQPAGERVVFDAILNEPYSSSVNATFTRALGDHGVAWRNFRTQQVTEQIFAWAARHGVPENALRVQPRTTLDGAKVDVSRSDPLRVATQSPRDQAAKLLEMLTDDDIARLVIPTLLSTILIKSRM